MQLLSFRGNWEVGKVAAGKGISCYICEGKKRYRKRDKLHLLRDASQGCCTGMWHRDAARGCCSGTQGCCTGMLQRWKSVLLTNGPSVPISI